MSTTNSAQKGASVNDREYYVHLTDGEVVEPDIVKVKESGWLYCCWTGNVAGGEQRTYAPHAVEYYDSRPAGEGDQ